MWEYLVLLGLYPPSDRVPYCCEVTLSRGEYPKLTTSLYWDNYPTVDTFCKLKIWQGFLLKFSCWVCGESSYLIVCPLLACLCCGFILGRYGTLAAFCGRGCDSLSRLPRLPRLPKLPQRRLRRLRWRQLQLSQLSFILYPIKWKHPQPYPLGGCRWHAGYPKEAWQGAMCVAANDRQVVAST